MKITKIVQDVLPASERPKLRVAAYCRVSTDSDEQLGSLEKQMKHYEASIRADPDWTFAGVYFDEGITGTKKEKRPGLLRMIADSENGKIDLILTKSVSRFARNTTDCLELVRKLLDLGVFIQFEKENIHTGSMESELMLSILSKLAESESESIAENGKWAIKRRFQNGTFKISCPPYGYDTAEGKLVVDETEAEIVQFIFARILSGEGAGKVAVELNRRNIPTRKGSPWSAGTIRGMVRNEKYTGDAIFQKTYTDGAFNRHRNDEVEEKYLIKNHHEAIVSHADFDAAQLMMDQHGKEKGVQPGQAKYQNRYPFSGKIICGLCGDTFKRRTHGSGRKYIAWCCATHLSDLRRCSLKFVPESEIEYAFVTMMNKLTFGHKTILKPLMASLREMNSDTNAASIRDLDRKLRENAEQQKVLVSLMSKGYLEPAVYSKSNNELIQEAARVQRQKESTVQFLNSEGQHLNEVGELLRYATKGTMLHGFDGEVFSRFVQRIIVYSRSEIGFELKCGITLKERLTKQ